MVNKNPYAGNFHQTRHQETNYAAKKILTILLDVFEIHSAIDIGCGVGTFLWFLEQRGVSDILGLDGDWVNHELLVITPDKFLPVDLKTLPKFERAYDLLICLEVAEHLPPEYAADFIGKLCKLSNLVLFSAAVPGQKGRAHLNEAWQSYWAKLFAEHNYHPLDLIRPKIWHDSAIPFWYRQNTLVYVKAGEQLAPQNFEACPLDIIHPELFQLRTNKPAPTPLFKRLLKKLKIAKLYEKFGR